MCINRSKKTTLKYSLKLFPESQRSLEMKLIYKSTAYSQKCVGLISDRSLLQAYSATEPPLHPPPKVNASCTLRVSVFKLTLSH